MKAHSNISVFVAGGHLARFFAFKNWYANIISNAGGVISFAFAKSCSTSSWGMKGGQWSDRLVASKLQKIEELRWNLTCLHLRVNCAGLHNPLRDYPLVEPAAPILEVNMVSIYFVTVRIFGDIKNNSVPKKFPIF